MLVLSFMIGEGCYIGRGCHFIVQRMGGGQVKIAFDVDELTHVSRDRWTLESHLAAQDYRERVQSLEGRARMKEEELAAERAGQNLPVDLGKREPEGR